MGCHATICVVLVAWPLSSLLRDILKTVAWKIRVSRFLMHLGCQAEHMVKQSVEILSRKLPTPR